MHSRPTVTPLRLFFANYVGLSGPFGIALTGNDDGIRRVEKQGVVRHLPLPQPRAVGLIRPAPELNPKENADEDPDQHQGRVQPPTRPAWVIVSSESCRQVPLLGPRGGERSLA